MYRSYLKLTKPGIVLGNMISLSSGYFLASRITIHWSQLVIVLLSVALVIGSGCAVNNIVDRDIDALMTRTRTRPMVNGEISTRAALLFAGPLALSGFVLLYQGTKCPVAVMLLLVGYIVYTGFYTLFFKRHSIHGTMVGSFSGAMPPVVGYCAASGRFDTAALILWIMFCIWQMPHSYAIAIFRSADYRAAAIPVYPLVKGTPAAKRHIIGYIFAFTCVAALLVPLGYAGAIYLLAVLASGISWLWIGLRGLKAQDDILWARQLFFISIVVVTILSIAMSIDRFSPPYIGML
ncbi:protoheme IX farnesyltransferase [Paraburkholderia sp. BL6665CI2N2]|uniref:heme o synthase n=1 Tax=Paraburkholderia sp. BL6665CI2N2 TaxID=1938806 RepID=UPI0010656755|nr:heme o synthase [Paraburkholderia sp. BL6665CI2N2]TDY16958.1 protoheme IX farnesyltransferase [Paraburkholderia sp. BL6665CI2N2]